MIKKERMLIVDDEDAILFTLEELFADSFEIAAFNNPKAAHHALLEGRKFDIVLMDFRMHGMNGVDLLTQIKKHLSVYRAVLITAYSSRELLEKGINEHLFDKVVNKPFDEESLFRIVSDLSKEVKRERSEKDYYSILENQLLSLSESFGFSDNLLVHSCAKMRQIVSQARKYGASNANVLIEGESGVGKEIVAHIIHEQSARAQKPMVKINCAAIPDQLFESELFGHKRGAFTGAVSDKMGRFQVAQGGTVFLDEIGELSLNHQSKLLRVLEDREVTPVGSPVSEKVDVRIVSATNRNLESLVEKELFRGDLRYRINILSIKIPPLRQRREDIPLLTVYFLANIAKNEGNENKYIDKECLDYISMLNFKGNIRELKNLIYRAYLLTDKPVIEKSDIISILEESEKSKKWEMFSRSPTLSDLESQYIHYQLVKNDYHLTRTARILGMEPSNFSRKLKNLGIKIRSIKKRV